MRNNKLILILLVVFMILLSFSGCKKPEEKKKNQFGITEVNMLGADNIEEDPKFGAANINVTQEEFFALGFNLGDSVDLKFSNGYELIDIPFFNGYYVKKGAPILVAYPGFEYISVTLNNEGIWQTGGFKEGDTVEITVNTPGKYLAIQEALGQSYSTVITDYEDEIEFSNFRALSGGNLKKDFLYRGASPVDNARGRALYVNNLLESTGIQFVIDLADDVSNMEGFIQSEDFQSEYAKKLYEDGNVALLAMGSSFASDKYKQSLATGFKTMLTKQGPVYIHCLEGKDRTGFVCLLVEALAGASYEEMKNDYMITYKNYYKISPEKSLEKYEAIVDLYFNAFVEYLHGTSDLEILKNADYTEDAKRYLTEAGMSEEEINALVQMITE